MKTVRKATAHEIIKIGSILKDVLIIESDEPNNKICRYKPEWDDEKVAKTVAPDLLGSHAQRIRREIFGNLSNHPGGNKHGERLDALERRMQSVEIALVKLAGELGMQLRLEE